MENLLGLRNSFVWKSTGWSNSSITGPSSSSRSCYHN